MNEHLKDAKAWLECAEFILNENSRVAFALSAHSLIKSLDALFEEKLNKTPSRHDHATDFYKELLSKGLIRGEESKYANTIQNILQNKSSAEYHVKYFSKSDSRKTILQVKRIITMCEKYI